MCIQFVVISRTCPGAFKSTRSSINNNNNTAGWLVRMVTVAGQQSPTARSVISLSSAPILRYYDNGGEQSRNCRRAITGLSAAWSPPPPPPSLYSRCDVFMSFTHKYPDGQINAHTINTENTTHMCYFPSVHYYLISSVEVTFACCSQCELLPHTGGYEWKMKTPVRDLITPQTEFHRSNAKCMNDGFVVVVVVVFNPFEMEQ